MTLFSGTRLGHLAAALAVLVLVVAPTAACRWSPGSARGETAAGDSSAAEPAESGQASSNGAPAGLEPFYDQDLSWSDCPDGAVGYQCATASVPLSYDDPAGQTVSIALRRLPASDGGAELGSLFLNPGGPGSSGTGMVASAASAYTPEMLASYDLIGFDPRGVGDSTRLTCWSPDDLAYTGGEDGDGSGDGGDGGAAGDDAAGAAPSDEAGGDAEPPEPSESAGPAGPGAAPSDDASPAPTIDDIFWTSTVAKGAADAAACRRYSEVPDLIDHMGTFDTARDLDVLRSAVGDERLAYLGYSYGTSIGSAYAELFPGNVGRVVLDGATDPTLTRSETADAQFAYRESRLRAYLDYCLGQDGCPVTGTVNEAVAQVTTFFKSLNAAPLTVTLDGRTSRMDGSAAFNRAQSLWLARPEYWDALTGALSRAMTRRDGSELARASALAPESGQITTPRTQEEARFAMIHTAVTCADSPDVADRAVWNANASRASEEYPFMSAMGSLPAGTDAYCHGWGVVSASAPTATRAPGSAPILVVGVTEDSQTPYSWAQSLASQLDAGHLLTVEGHQHGASLSNACATSRVSDYLVDGSLPDEGDVCRIDPLPADVADELAQ